MGGAQSAGTQGTSRHRHHGTQHAAAGGHGSTVPDDATAADEKRTARNCTASTAGSGGRERGQWAQGEAGQGMIEARTAPRTARGRPLAHTLE